MSASGIAVRACAGDLDRQVSLAIYNQVLPDEAVTLDEVHAWERRTSAHVDLVASVDGEPAGSGVAGIELARPGFAFVLITVLGEHRRRGVGTALYRELSAWAAERGYGGLETRARSDDEDSIAYALRRGFRVHGREPGLVLDLGTLSPPAVDPPDGIRVVPYEPRFVRAIHEIGSESFPDVPGRDDQVALPFETWVEGWNPGQTFVALADGNPVGYAKLHHSPARPKVGQHHMTAVRRAWRGRGVAGALKRAQIAWAKEAGLERLQTTNELRNEPIRRLNLALGYRQAPGRVWLRGPVLEPGGPQVDGDQQQHERSDH